jgi:transposase-like protein
MKLFDRKCLGCGATYRVAVSENVEGQPGHFTCAVCGDEFERWDEPSLRVCRLLFAAERANFRMPPSVHELP